MVDGRPMVVVEMAPRLRGRSPTARLSPDLPCGTCEEPLHYDALRRRWRCTECRTTYDGERLDALVGEHIRSGRVSRSRDNTGSRQVMRGRPGRAAVLLRAAGAGGGESREALLREVSGPERRALAWALRDAGEAPLSAERCRQAAAELSSLTPASLEPPP